MARPLRLEYEGAVYHVTIRGNQRGIIFQEDSDRERFIEKLAESVERYEIHLYLYTLMTNHVHMVLETPRANLSQFMHRLQTAYTVFYNRKHKLSGHLLQGRFGSTIVKEDEYILKLSRYVNLGTPYLFFYCNYVGKRLVFYHGKVSTSCGFRCAAPCDAARQSASGDVLQ